MDPAFTNRQRQTLTAAVDTFVASAATKGSDVGAHLAVADYLLTKLPPEQLAGMKQLLDPAGLIGFKNQSQPIREAIIDNLERISPESHGAIAALKQLSISFAEGPPGATDTGP